MLSNAPEIDVGDCSISLVVVVLCATSIGTYVVLFGNTAWYYFILQLAVAGEQSQACRHLNKRLDRL